MWRHILSLGTASFLSLLVGCASIPDQLQLLTDSGGSQPSIQAASCSPTSVAARSASRPDTALNPNHIALLNWNVYKGQRSNWLTDFQRFSQGQDVITLQEALLTDNLQTRLRTLRLRWTLNHAFIYGEHQTGVLTAARVDALSHCGLRNTEPLIRTPKTALIQGYPIDGQSRPLLVANLHGINFSLDTDAYRQQLLAVQTILVQHRGPLILAGDFNNWSDARSTVLQDMVDALHLQSITYQNHNQTRVFGHVIDHIYYRGLEAVNQQTFEVDSSDHNPIMVVFRLASPQIGLNPS